MVVYPYGMRRLPLLLGLLTTPAFADVVQAPTIVGVASMPAESMYTSIEADAVTGGSKFTGPWAFDGGLELRGAVTVTGGLTTDTLDVTGDATLGGLLEVTGAATFHSTAGFDGAVTAPHFIATDSATIQLGGNATSGLAVTATDLYLRTPGASGSVHFERLFPNGAAPVTALSYHVIGSGNPQFGGAAAAGVFTDATNVAVRAPNAAGGVYLQGPSGAPNLFQVLPPGHVKHGGGPPSVSSCGAGAFAVGSDSAFAIVTGPGTSTCSATFTAPFTGAVCVVTPRNGITYVPTITLSGAAISLAFTAPGTSIVFDVMCREVS